MKANNIFTVVILAAAALAVIFALAIETNRNAADIAVPDYVEVQLIDIDGEARSGIALDGVKDIVIHYAGNPDATAQRIRDGHNRKSACAYSHFIIGLEGEIIQCIPLSEKSSATNYRNSDTVSIEVCHPDESGRFTDAAYASLIKLTAWLCDTYGLTENNVIRHYDVTGKECPLYFVTHEDAWRSLRADVKALLHKKNLPIWGGFV